MRAQGAAHESFAFAEATSSATEPARYWLLAKLATWLKDCADHYAAAVAYEELSRLSDTQLRHRGLSRDILARNV